MSENIYKTVDYNNLLHFCYDDFSDKLLAAIDKGTCLIVGRGCSKIDYIKKISAKIINCKLEFLKDSPDFLLLEKNDNKAISIEEIREVQHFDKFSGSKEGKRLVVINDVQNINRNAVSALLKTIEEPSGSIIMLMCNDSDLLPDTILSRCILLRLPKGKIKKNEVVQLFGEEKSNFAMGLFPRDHELAINLLSDNQLTEMCLEIEKMIMSKTTSVNTLTRSIQKIIKKINPKNSVELIMRLLIKIAREKTDNTNQKTISSILRSCLEIDTDVATAVSINCDEETCARIISSAIKELKELERN